MNQAPKQIIEDVSNSTDIYNSKDFKRKTKEHVITATSNRISEILLSVTHLYIFPALLGVFCSKKQSSFFSRPSWALQAGNLPIIWHSTKNASCLHKNSRPSCFPSPKGKVPQLPTI